MAYILVAMAAEERQAKELAEPAVPRRLVKSWLPAELVRELDVHIVRSAGAYLDRAEFIAEAIRDRLDEERVGPAPQPPATLAGPAPQAAASYGRLDYEFGDWLDLEPPTLPRAGGPTENFGLHNRDLPTLWALDWLGREVAMRKAPVNWTDFIGALMPRAWEAGRALAGEGVVGFPTNVKRKDATEQRFIAHAVGLLGGRGGRPNSGPLFVFGLVGVNGADAAPTPAALELVVRLRERAFTAMPPFAPSAWEAFAGYLAAEAPTELEAWLYVLRLIAEEPTRTELVARCTRWSGSKAATNTMSYVARGREWGLVAPELIDGRYRLTDIGRAAVSAPVETTGKEHAA